MPNTEAADENSPLLAENRPGGPDSRGERVNVAAPRRVAVDVNRDGVPDSLVAQFCDSLDIIVPQDDQPAINPEKGGNYEEILRSIKKHYWISFGLNCLAVTLVVSQLLVGIIISTVTSLYGEKARTAIIILGGVNTLVGGLAATLHYWGEPARENRYYDSLRLIQKKVRTLMVKFKNPETQLNPYDEGEKLLETFTQAHADAWSNNPIIWLQGTRAPNGVGDHNRGKGHDVEEDDDDN